MNISIYDRSVFSFLLIQLADPLHFMLAACVRCVTTCAIALLSLLVQPWWSVIICVNDHHRRRRWQTHVHLELVSCQKQLALTYYRVFQLAPMITGTLRIIALDAWGHCVSTPEAGRTAVDPCEKSAQTPNCHVIEIRKEARFDIRVRKSEKFDVTYAKNWWH